MTDALHVVRIIANLLQLVAVLAFIFMLWKWSKPKKKIQVSCEQQEAADKCAALLLKLEKENMERLNQRM